MTQRVCVTEREVSMKRGGTMWKRHWQRHWQNGAKKQVRGVAAQRKKSRGRTRMGPGKPWIGGGEKESTLAAPTLFE